MMEINNKEYEVKPCPLCGETDMLRVTPYVQFHSLFDENGAATIVISCERCHLDVYEHDYSGRNYNKKIRILLEKWNRRCSNA